MDNWKIGILSSIRDLGGEADLKQIYRTISKFVELTEEHLRETRFSGRLNYQHMVRSRASNMASKGELERIQLGRYRITAAGIRLLERQAGREDRA